jgi:hypothetical protein
MKRSFTYGRLLVNINLKYGDVGFSSKKKEGGSVAAREFGIIFSRLSFMLGILIGFVFRKG